MRESKGEDKTSMEHIINDEMEIVATDEDIFYELVAEQKESYTALLIAIYETKRIRWKFYRRQPAVHGLNVKA